MSKRTVTFEIKQRSHTASVKKRKLTFAAVKRSITTEIKKRSMTFLHEGGQQQ